MKSKKREVVFIFCLIKFVVKQNMDVSRSRRKKEVEGS